MNITYWTYGGFDAVTDAFTKIALIFSDTRYHEVFLGVIVIGALFGFISTVYAKFRGSMVSLFSWVIPIMAGVMIYWGLVAPKGTVTVYDPVVNRFQVVSNIPDGILAVAGALNTIERGFVDIIYTTATPSSYRYQDYAGGIGYNVLLKATGFPLKLPNQYIDESIRKYIDDCLYFELMRPGTTLSVNAIASNSTDFLNEFAQAQNPAIYTVFYDDNPTDRTGTTMTCTEAWNRINTYLTNPANFQDMIDYTCSNSGFNPNNTAEMTKCRNTIRAYIDVVFGSPMGVTEVQFLRQAYLAQVLNDVILKNDPDLALRALANRNIMNSSIGAGIVANEWLPIIRAIVTSVVLGLMPFFAIFIPTPVVSRALGIVAGFFVWLAAWGVTDAVVHSLAMDQAVKAFEEIRQNSLGLASMNYFPDASMKALGIFGLVRTFGIMLATIFTGMLTRFGGHALAMMSSNLMGTVRGAGSYAGSTMLTPEGTTKTLKEEAEVYPTHAWANHYPIESRWRIMYGDQATRTE
ncbi:MAG: conjugal transfer protein TraG, partial [Nitrospirae bacterium]